MDVKDLQQENSRKIVEEIIKSIKLDEDNGAGITGKFVFCFEKDNNSIRTVIEASSSILLHLMDRFFKTLQEESPVYAYVAEGILKGVFSQKKIKRAPLRAGTRKGAKTNPHLKSSTRRQIWQK